MKTLKTIYTYSVLTFPWSPSMTDTDGIKIYLKVIADEKLTADKCAKEMLGPNWRFEHQSDVVIITKE